MDYQVSNRGRGGAVMMKAFVYKKKGSKRVAILTDVKEVKFNQRNKVLTLITKDAGNFMYDTSVYKISIFQN